MIGLTTAPTGAVKNAHRCAPQLQLSNALNLADGHISQHTKEILTTGDVEI